MKLWNTLSARKEQFVPQGDEVGMYVCGVTPYSEAHIGHAMSYIFFDVIRRYLQFSGYRLKYVQNFTDIDDKIINRAREGGITFSELAERHINGFLEDMRALNVRPADVYPRATGEIPAIISVINGLMTRGFAYRSRSGVYFRVRMAGDYGKLSRRTPESIMAGARIEVDEDKEEPVDFALWKACKPGEPSWESPWGPGRPGWHIECSAMSLKYLGENIDIHGGGQDLIFPHHENEIAQSEGFTGKKPFARYWLHNGLLQFGEEKMSKSLGNLITIKQSLKDHSADGLRLFVLSSHYRSPLKYSEEALAAAESGADRLGRVVNRDVPAHCTSEALDAEPYRRQFVEAMDDDFNTPQALGVLFDLAREINQAADSGRDFVGAREVLVRLAKEVLGLTFRASDASFPPETDGYMALVEERNRLRKEKRWKEADEIRVRLAGMGVALEDTAKGTVIMPLRKKC